MDFVCLKNLACTYYELDLILSEADYFLVFAEVHCGRQTGFKTITAAKQARIRKAYALF